MSKTQETVSQQKTLGRKERGRAFKEKILNLLSAENPECSVETLCQFPERQVINPLCIFLCHSEPHIRCRAIRAAGAVVANLAEKDMESARVLMRRMMWNLNDESGGIGWGMPEAMGESMAHHQGLAREYARILISYAREDGNFLEYEPLQRGVLWGLGRLAQARPHLLQDHVSPLKGYLTSDDGTLRGLAAWIMGLIGAGEARSGLEQLVEDTTEITFCENGKARTCRVSDLAREALAKIDAQSAVH
ncbi:MAG: DVU0298 family protein [Syntrophobacteria bacterium]